ncbi:MAG: DUF6489 family protein [Magnetospirillum sp.]|nr:DUF6489 family protein [Magnetospirillum sp.]
MKITFDMDCTPEELRAFLGVPDIRPMQDAVLRKVQDRMMAALSAMEPETMFRAWLPAQVQTIERFQKAFWPFAGSGREETPE